MAGKKVKNKVPSTRYKYYKIEGSKLVRTKKTCPKCGAGYFLAQHKDRDYCGNCHYTEFKSKEAPKEKPIEKPVKKK